MKKLGFGFMRMPLTDPNDQTAIDMPQLNKMVDLFFAAGFTYCDTAWMYHDFMSEPTVGIPATLPCITRRSSAPGRTGPRRRSIM